MHKLTALKNLVKKLSGQDSKAQTISQAIQEITASDIGGVLPSGGNVGDVLGKTADGAVWRTETQELPSGGNVGDVLKKTADGSEWATDVVGGDIVVTITQSDSTYSADKTFAEIVAAFPNAKAVFNGNVFDCSGYEENDNVVFSRVKVNSVDVEEEAFIFNADGTVEYYDGKYPQGE